MIRIIFSLFVLLFLGFSASLMADQSKEDAALLLAKSGDAVLRRVAIEQLGNMVASLSDKAVDVIVASLKDADDEVRGAAGAVFIALGDRGKAALERAETATMLEDMKIVNNPANADAVRLAAVQKLVGKDLPQVVVTELEKAMKDAKDDVRQTATALVISYYTKQLAKEQLAKEKAAADTTKTGVTPTLPTVVTADVQKQLDILGAPGKKNGQRALAAAEQLKKLGKTGLKGSALSQLLGFLNAADANARDWTVWLLGEIEETDALAALEARLPIERVSGHSGVASRIEQVITRLKAVKK